ncbi:dual specificity protein phosphatase 22 isoform X3 [Opisthocomus hoazin]|uniref:dual specificity protein phosphatase 22 isoform X3 n=1 Tax=Opisthocomus hoazin TaxID=30419 RepID=UPI003F52C523
MLFCLACSLATLKGLKYLCIPAADSPSQNLARHFRESIKFIHECRLTGEGCLVHCLAGVSRSVTLVVAYIMTITDFGWEDALSVVRAARSCANPNMGFQRQLQDFEKHDVDQAFSQMNHYLFGISSNCPVFACEQKYLALLRDVDLPVTGCSGAPAQRCPRWQPPLRADVETGERFPRFRV